MKKQATLKLSIPTPCTQNWNQMTATQRGRFCASCNKHVTDFTNFTDKELKDFFARNSGEVCGRLTTDQVERELILQEHAKRGYLIPKLFIGAALAIALTSKADAQKKEMPAFKFETEMTSEPVKKMTPEPQGGNSNYIVGKVGDSLGEGVPFASVIIKETGFGTITDMDGNFKLEVPELFKGRSVILQFSSVGYQTKEMTVLTNGSPARAEIILNEIKDIEMEYVTMGCVVVTVEATETSQVILSDVFTPDGSLWERISGWPPQSPAGSTRNY